MAERGEMERQDLNQHKALRRFLLGWICIFTVVALGQAKTSAKPQKESLNFGGEKRTYYVFSPSGFTAPAPLLLLLHGSGHDGMSLIDPWRVLHQTVLLRAVHQLLLPDIKVLFIGQRFDRQVFRGGSAMHRRTQVRQSYSTNIREWNFESRAGRRSFQLLENSLDQVMMLPASAFVEV